jgi:hypothetical protein
MYLLSKTVERLVGTACYDAGAQEVETTRRTLDVALALAPEHSTLSFADKVSLSLGAGVSFAESRLRDGALEPGALQAVQEVAYRYHRAPLAIDHRAELVSTIADAGHERGTFRLAVVLDDTTESVVDLLWLQDLLQAFPFLTIELLVNTAQISINFSADMLSRVCATGVFRPLASRLGAQVVVTPVYCPLISFQTAYLPFEAHRAIRTADAVFVKGANFFETCQIPDKPTFHAFVVFGPVSRRYTGLNDLSPVFVHLPAGVEGYRHRGREAAPITLVDVTRDRGHVRASPGGPR